MSTILRIENVSRSLLAMLCIGGGLVACTTQESNSGGTGGSTPPAGSGGATTGTGGAGVAGTTGSAATDGTLCLPPQELITDFTYAPSDAGTSTTEVHFGNGATFGGGESSWTNSTTYPLTSDVTKSNWHISGTVDNYAGFNLYFDNCTRLNASAFKGISFKISGSVGSTNKLTFGMGTLNDSITGEWLNAHGGSAKTDTAGRCVPPATAVNQYAQSTCADPTKSIDVTADVVTQTIYWADLTGGKPDANPGLGDGITSIYWSIPWSTGATFAVDVTIDDLKFIP
jgi:hypothetical protein